MRIYVILVATTLMFVREAKAAEVPPALTPATQDDREREEAAAVEAEEGDGERACGNNADEDEEARECDLTCYGTHETCCCTAGQKCQVYDCFPNKCCQCKTT